MSGFLISSGRVSLGASQAMSSRYTTPMFIFWGCLIATYLAYQSKINKNNAGRSGMLFVIIFWLFIVPDNNKFEREFYMRKAGLLQVAKAITNETYKLNPTILSWLGNTPQLIAGQIDFLRVNRLSLFIGTKHVKN